MTWGSVLALILEAQGSWTARLHFGEKRTGWSLDAESGPERPEGQCGSRPRPKEALKHGSSLWGPTTEDGCFSRAVMGTFPTVSIVCPAPSAAIL